jgi:hypothetical protein
MARTGERRTPVQVKLTRAEIDEIDAWAAAAGILRSDQLRLMLAYAAKRIRRRGEL